MAQVVLSKMGMVNFIEGYDGKSFVGMKTVTEPKLNVKGRTSKLTLKEKLGIDPANVRKFSRFVAGMGYDYAQGIENRLLAEGKDPTTYKAGASWHVPFINPETGKESSTIRQHKDSKELYFYVFGYANNTPNSHYEDISTGKVIDKADLEEYLPKESAPKNQGLEEGNEVMVRTLKLDSVKEISAFGNVYTIG